MRRLKPNSMFSRLMVLFTVIILIIMIFSTLGFYITIRNDRINNRLGELENQAQEMAYLAQMKNKQKLESTASTVFGFSQFDQTAYKSTQEYMKWKKEQLMEDYGAYILILDMFGRMELEYSSNFKTDENIEEKLKVFKEVLPTVLKGETVIAKLGLGKSNRDSMFVISVPYFGSTNNVRGAVFLYTSVKEVQATYEELLHRTLMLMMASFVLAFVFAYAFTKQTTKPLASMVKATEEMAKGNFEQKAEVEGTEEIQRLAESFNTMSEQLSRLEESRREFVANVSHELRSPMTSIHGFIQGMLDGTIPVADHPKYLQIVSDETTRLTKLINELLQLSRIEQGKTSLRASCFDINELLRRVLVRRYNDIEQKQIEIEIEFEKERAFCVGDVDAIEQVAVNLLDNAIKFTPEKGRIWIGSKEKGDKNLMWVADDGQKILPGDLPHIFERFYKGDKSHTPGHGTGLGLSISQKIISDHGEDIWCESDSRKTSFFFTLLREDKEGKNEKK